MNQQVIKRLEIQCWEERQYGPPWFNATKFASLIVDECVGVCLARRDPTNLNYKPSVAFADDIKMHFGLSA